MTLKPRPHPAALRHGPIKELLPGVYMVTGTVAMPGPMPVRFSRNMAIVQEGERLVLINSVRLGDEGLAELDALGRVTDVVRLAGNHGMDDPFYKERYGAKVWAVAGQRYTAGFATDAPNTYFEPDAFVDAGSPLPLTRSMLHVMNSTPPEALLLIERDGGVIISGDCLQNWAMADEYFSGLGKLMMRLLGFIRPHNIGPGWLKQTKPPKADLRAILDLRFEHVIPAHGTAVIGDARSKYEPALDRVSAR